VDLDGKLLHRYVHTPEQLFYNVATLPGWQKWKPMFRVGRITAIDYDADTASVELDEARSSATGEGTEGSPTTGKDWDGPPGDPQGLKVNQDMPLDQIPVVYMECNADAFEVGDRVIVEFPEQEWDNARVIGFESHPQECPSRPMVLGLVLEMLSRKAGTLDRYNYPDATSIIVFCGDMEERLSSYTDLEYYVKDTEDNEYVLFTPKGSATYTSSQYQANGETVGQSDGNWYRYVNTNKVIPSPLCENHTGDYSVSITPSDGVLPADFTNPPAKLPVLVDGEPGDPPQWKEAVWDGIVRAPRSRVTFWYFV
jgi:hypothetical protein